MYKKLVNNIISILSVIVILSAIIALIPYLQEKQDVYIGDYKPVIVKTETLRPDLRPYDILITKKTDIDDIYIGDFVLIKENEDVYSLAKVYKNNKDSLIVGGTLDIRSTPVSKSKILGAGQLLIRTSPLVLYNNDNYYPILSIFLAVTFFVLLCVFIRKLYKYTMHVRESY